MLEPQYILIHPVDAFITPSIRNKNFTSTYAHLQSFVNPVDYHQEY